MHIEEQHHFGDTLKDDEHNHIEDIARRSRPQEDRAADNQKYDARQRDYSDDPYLRERSL